MSELESDLFWRPEALKVVRTQSPRMRQVLEKLKSVAPTRTTVLLLGDTGVGKGMIAKLIHQHSSRSEMPFVHLHCGAIPETLFASVLFGHVRGSRFCRSVFFKGSEESSRLKQMSASSLHPTQTSVLSVRKEVSAGTFITVSVFFRSNCLRFGNGPKTYRRSLIP